MNHSQRVFVGLGSNLDQPEQQVLKALAALAATPDFRLVASSRLWHSDPWGHSDQPGFINAVAEFRSDQTPEALLKQLASIERSLGRRRTGPRWGPRSIDLDLLAVGAEQRAGQTLELPHPRLAERRFVLAPWAEIGADFQLPDGRSVAQLLEACDDAGAARPVGELALVGPVERLREIVSGYRQAGQSVALVPTMGNLHAGHLSLVQRARQLAQRVVVSLFVNPTQFGPGEDFTTYPRTLASDLQALQAAGVDLAWAPEVTDIYPGGLEAVTTVQVPVPAAGQLCDAGRPGHFDGVATVVSRLFCAVWPDVAVLGQKDYQQLKLIERLARDLLMPVKIVAAPIVREPSGLAMSSRNGYLSDDQRQLAARLYETLSAAARQLTAGEIDPAQVMEQAMAALNAAGLNPEYLALRNAEDLSEAAPDDPVRVLAAAVRVGTTRLIDNVIVTR